MVSAFVRYDHNFSNQSTERDINTVVFWYYEYPSVIVNKFHREWYYYINIMYVRTLRWTDGRSSFLHKIIQNWIKRNFDHRPTVWLTSSYIYDTPPAVINVIVSVCALNFDSCCFKAVSITTKRNWFQFCFYNILYFIGTRPRVTVFISSTFVIRLSIPGI